MCGKPLSCNDSGLLHFRICALIVSWQKPRSDQYSLKVEAVFQSALPMQYSWGKVVPEASQLLQQILAQPVNSGTPFKPVVREQPSIEMDGTMRNNIPLLRAGINTFMTPVCH